MTKAPTSSANQSQETAQRHHKKSITQRLQTDLGRLAGLHVTIVIHLVLPQ